MCIAEVSMAYYVTLLLLTCFITKLFLILCGITNNSYGQCCAADAGPLDFLERVPEHIEWGGAIALWKDAFPARAAAPPTFRVSCDRKGTPTTG